MPYEIIEEHNGLVFRFRGDVVTKEIMTANKEGWEHPKWRTHRYQIWDYTNVDTIIFEEQDSLLFAKMDSVAFQVTLPMKIAFVANNQHIIDLCESYIANLETENLEARIFGDDAAARQWVDG
jgi:hypothetical protein